MERTLQDGGMERALGAADGVRTPLHARAGAEASDSDLVARIRAGDEAAFEALYARYARGILSYSRHMLGSLEDAEEATQHAFIASYREIAGGEREIEVRPWLYAVARNRCLSILRSRREEATEEIEVATDGLSQEVERRAELRELVADLHDLPDRQRSALLLTELGDLSQSEIARILECKVGQVKGLVFRARSALMERRSAREADCAEVREELASATGGTFRKGRIKHHLEACTGCAEYMEEVRRQRAQMAVALPVIPAPALFDGIASSLGLATTTAAAASSAVSGAAGAGAAGAGAGASAAAGAGGAGSGLAAVGAAASGVLTSAAAKVAAVVIIGGAAVAGTVNEIASDPPASTEATGLPPASTGSPRGEAGAGAGADPGGSGSAAAAAGPAGATERQRAARARARSRRPSQLEEPGAARGGDRARGGNARSDAPAQRDARAQRDAPAAGGGQAGSDAGQGAGGDRAAGERRPDTAGTDGSQSQPEPSQPGSGSSGEGSTQPQPAPRAPDGGGEAGGAGVEPEAGGGGQEQGSTSSADKIVEDPLAEDPLAEDSPAGPGPS